MEGSGAMRSIDNLREYALTAASVNATTRAVLAGYVDEIEREVADMVPLPLDADGEPIHVGDVMEWMAGGTFEVVGIGNGGTLYYLDTYDDGTVGVEWTAAGDKRHHHAPTVEDVLREFADAWTEWKDGAAMMNPVETFAAKLRLAGEE